MDKRSHILNTVNGILDYLKWTSLDMIKRNEYYSNTMMHASITSSQKEASCQKKRFEVVCLDLDSAYQL